MCGVKAADLADEGFGLGGTGMSAGHYCDSRYGFSWWWRTPPVSPNSPELPNSPNSPVRKRPCHATVHGAIRLDRQLHHDGLESLWHT